MNKTDVTKFFKGAKLKLSKHSPEVLVGLGITGMCVTTVLAVKATPKALKLIEEKKQEECTDELTPVEVVQTCWKPYVPAAVTGVVSIACLVGSSSVSARRNAALATAYTISETALREYKEKVVETIGEKKEQAVREKVAQKQIEKHPVGKSEVIITGNGKTLCYDTMTGRYFESDIETIRKAANEINRRITLGEMYASLNEFHDIIGLSATELGDYVGWNVDALVELDFSSHISEDGRPCIVVGFMVAPTYNFEKLI